MFFWHNRSGNLKEYRTKEHPDYYAGTKTDNKVFTISSGERPGTNYKSYIEIYVQGNIPDNIRAETVSGQMKVNSYTGRVWLSKNQRRHKYFRVFRNRVIYPLGPTAGK